MKQYLTPKCNLQELENKMEGIESQGGDEDYTIAPVGSHQSFAAMARCASTPFNENHEGPPILPNLSNIQADKTASNTPVLSNTADSQGVNSFFPDQQNLRLSSISVSASSSRILGSTSCMSLSSSSSRI